MACGIPSVAAKDQVNNTTEKANELTKSTDTTLQSANALGSAPGALSGAGNIQRSSGEYLLTIDREAYKAGVLKGVRSFNAEVANAAAAATAAP